ncbi:MAG: hypothetical protein VX335_03505 [Pseudomonadota bacterium]|nr:hypothetical protein [Pseudomonadota bacterium]
MQSPRKNIAIDEKKVCELVKNPPEKFKQSEILLNELSVEEVEALYQLEEEKIRTLFPRKEEIYNLFRSHLSVKAQLCLDPRVTSVRETNILVVFDNIINLIKQDLTRKSTIEISTPKYSDKTIDTVAKFLKDITPTIGQNNGKLLYTLFFTEKIDFNSNDKIANNRGNEYLISMLEESIKSVEELEKNSLLVKTDKTNTRNTQAHNVKEKSMTNPGKPTNQIVTSSNQADDHDMNHNITKRDLVEKSPVNEKEPKTEVFLNAYMEARGQVISRGATNSVKNNIGLSGFFKSIGWGNWLAAFGIAAGAITPLLMGGWPMYYIGAALILGLFFWRETNFDPTRANFATNTKYMNSEGQLENVRSVKTHKFHQRAVDMLRSADSLGKSSDEKMQMLGEFIAINSFYRSLKTKDVNKAELVKESVARISDNLSKLIDNKSQLLGNIWITINENMKEFTGKLEVIASDAIDQIYSNTKSQESCGTINIDKSAIIDCETNSPINSDNNLCAEPLSGLLDTTQKISIESHLIDNWYEAINSSNLTILEIDSVRALVKQQDERLVNNTQHKNVVKSVKKFSRYLALSAAIFGNALGCFVAGLNSMGFFAGSLITHYTVIPVFIPLLFASLMGYAGYWAYESNTGPALQTVIKSFLYDILAYFRGNREATPFSTRKVIRTTLMITGIICSLTMGIAIGTFNLQFGNFLVAVIANPSILSNTYALATFAAPTTTAGLIVGYLSAGLVTIGTTALFLRYIVSGLVDLVPAEKAKVSDKEITIISEETNPLLEDKEVAPAIEEQIKPKAINASNNFSLRKAFHTLFTLAIIAAVTYFSVYSVAYFVSLSVPLAYKSLAMLTVYITGSFVYIMQAYNVSQGILKNYGHLLGNSDEHNIKLAEDGLAPFKASDEIMVKLQSNINNEIAKKHQESNEVEGLKILSEFK